MVTLAGGAEAEAGTGPLSGPSTLVCVTAWLGLGRDQFLLLQSPPSFSCSEEQGGVSAWWSPGLCPQRPCSAQQGLHVSAW